ncbi:hypothetical protein [Pseudonocardia oroxyli]|uniref:Uncharacterized protein n=1 Tax=Pseudonocardia oroxyli TaxID=366584 RepID=A0A1G8BD60_PSEOR|nr:hypothetical protein [Pseudonocardia oroxyli]SDH31139.1 hypothetical protein SAMN05216377_1217 [Pseudonocardia oroxyli]
MDLGYVSATTGLDWEIAEGSPVGSHCVYGLAGKRKASDDIIFSTSVESAPTLSSLSPAAVQAALGCDPESVDPLSVALHAFSCTDLARPEWVYAFYPGGDRYLVVRGLVPEGDLRTALLQSWEPQLPWLIAA